MLNDDLVHTINDDLVHTEFMRDLMVHANLQAISLRIKNYLIIRGLSYEELGVRVGSCASAIKYLNKQAKPHIILWRIIRSENLSIRWLYTGEGEYNDDDPVNYLPSTIIHERGVGVRKSMFRREAEEGELSGNPLEFVLAIDAYKRANHKPYPTWTEIYELILNLGYRKVVSPKINPMVYAKLNREGN